MLTLPLAIAWFAAVALATVDGRQRRFGWAAVGALAATLAATVWLGVEVVRDGPVEVVAGGWPEGVGITLRADALGVTFAVLSLAVLLVALAYEVIGGVRSRVFPALVLFMAVGLSGLCLTGDVINFYVFFEIAMISAYVLATYGEWTRQLRAATIFAPVNLLGSVLFLIAIASLYHLTGSLDMRVIARTVPVVQENPAVLSATLIFVAFGVKLGLFPFHFWLAAVYTGTRPAVAAILSGALANIGSYGLLRFGGDLLPRELERGAPVLLVLGAASIVYGALQAVSCGAPSEVLAYSSIGQVGYILVALAVGGEVGFAASVLYSVVNSVNKTLLFLAVPLRGWLVGGALAVGAFSVAGLPPAVGFFGKAALFRAGIAEGSSALLVLLFVGGALSFVYLFQLYGRRFWVIEPPDTGDCPPLGAVAGPSLLAHRLLLLALAGVVVGLGIWPEPLLALSAEAAAVLPAAR